MMPSTQTAIVWAIVIVIFALATEAMMTIAIVKKKRMKASGHFLKFGFTIEASDDDRSGTDD
jgi:hypothetical protein